MPSYYAFVRFGPGSLQKDRRPRGQRKMFDQQQQQQQQQQSNNLATYLKVHW